MYLVRIHDEGVLGILVKSDAEMSLIKYYLDGISYSTMMYDGEFTVLYEIEELSQ